MAGTQQYLPDTEVASEDAGAAAFVAVRSKAAGQSH
jgi:hypothetical protein